MVEIKSHKLIRVGSSPAPATNKAMKKTQQYQFNWEDCFTERTDN